MNKPIVGQILYSLNMLGVAKNCEQKLTKVIVRSVGRKYFTCSQEDMTSKWGQTQYCLSDWTEKTEYAAYTYLYDNPQDWEDEKEISKICQNISSCFEYNRNLKGFSLDVLRKIDLLINDKKNNE